MNSREADQSKGRKYQYFRDQFQRRYGANVETSTGDPCGPLEPKFIAPLDTPSEFMRLVRDDDGRTSIFIDFDAWLGEVRARIMDWRRQAQKMMIARHRDKYFPDMQLDADVFDVIGPEPSISPKWAGGSFQPIVAAKAGNKWVLGLTDVIDPRVAKFLAPVIPEAEADYASDYDPELERVFDEEEEADPDALGGKTVPTPSSIHRRTASRTTASG